MAETPCNNGRMHSEFYIEAKHQNIKSELLFNSICRISLNHWEQSRLKARNMLKTNRMRQMICDVVNSKQYYNINEGSLMNCSQLIAIMVHCNFDVLQDEFNKTLRRQNEDETVTSIITRHSHFANWARLLREC
eukprot:1003444_1